MKPHRRRTKFLRAKIDTCSNVNLMPISVYKLLYKDKDCMKVEPSTKAVVKTYTTEKIKIVGSCIMFVVHPDTRLLHEVTFHVTSHEGSVIVSCVTILELSRIHPHTNLDELPEEGSLIYSKADMPKQMRNKKCEADKNNVKQSVTKEENTEDMQLPKPARLCRDKNCQSPRCYKNISPRRPIQNYR